MLSEVFSDTFAQKNNFLTRIDSRLKIIFMFGAMLIILSSPSPFGPVITAFIVIISLLIVRVPLGLIMLRLAAPLGLAAAVLVMQTFFYGTTPLFRLNLAGLNLTAFLEGWNRGLLIMTRVIGATSLVLFLSLTTPVNNLLMAAAWFRVPKIWIEISLLTYRYVFVLLEDAVTVMNAQKVRLGYTNLLKTFVSLGHLAGTIVIRAYDQSLRTYEAMMLRGYQDRMPGFCGQKLKLKDGLAALALALVLVALWSLNWR